MVELLASPDVRSQIARLSVAQYHKLSAMGILPERTELIEGLVLCKMPKPPEHTYAVAVLERFLRLIFPDHCIRKEEPLSLKDSEPEPDLAVAEGSIADFRGAHPHIARLVVEVSKTTYSLDFDKQFIYARAGIQEYWLVDLERKQVELYQEPEASMYVKKQFLGSGTAITIGQQSLAVNELWA